MPASWCFVLECGVEKGESLSWVLQGDKQNARCVEVIKGRRDGDSYLPQQADNLATTFGCEIEIVDGGDAANGLVGGGLCSAALGGNHVVCFLFC